MIFTTFFLFVANYNYAQKNVLTNDAQKNAVIERRVETIAQNSENENIDFTTLFDMLSSFYENPINLNEKNVKEDLLETRLLTEFQINALIDHIKKNGNLMSIYELQSVNDFDPETIRDIMPFVTVNTDLYSPHTNFKDMMENATNTVFLRYSRILEKQKGYRDISDEEWLQSENTKYLGNQDKLYMRYRFKYLNNVSIGFTAEKDPGESFLGNKRAKRLFGTQQTKGFDFYSAHFYLKNIGKVKGLAIGDYHMQIGQGLTIWTGLAFRKTIDVMSYKRYAQGIRPYASVNENNFLRGGAITFAPIKKIEITAFGSKKRIDANLLQTLDTTLQGMDYVASTFTSFQSTGYHNTIGTLKDKDALLETFIGGNVKFINKSLKIGLTGVHSNYSGNIERNLVPYSKFRFNSSTNNVIGTDYSYIYKNFNFYGELSRSQNGGTAMLHGLLASLDPKLSASILYRNYGRDYQSVRSRAFAESSKNINEKGLIIGLEAKPNLKWTINTYMDQFKFPWLRNQVDKPNTFGHDGILQVKYKHSKKLEMYGRIRNRIKPKNTNEDVSDIPTVVDLKIWNYRFNVSYKMSETILLKNRIEYKTYKRGDSPQENGYLVYQDIAYKPLSSPFSFTFRYALFQTDSYNARIYAYESNVLYAYSIPSYYNRGTRIQLTTRYRIRKGIDIWLRWAQWHYNDVEIIGSGLNEINGNNKTQVKAMIRFKF